ncbi:MAG: hypothetical protein AVDCRST_MAG62-1371, partial [uncultured Sphingomonas sp.]
GCGQYRRVCGVCGVRGRVAANRGPGAHHAHPHRARPGISAMPL